MKEINNKNLTAIEILSKYAPNIYKFLEGIVGSEFIILQIVKLGYCFYRANPFKTIFMELGETNSGKSTYLKLIIHILGEKNISTETLQALSIPNNFCSINLYHKLANIRADLPKTEIKYTGTIKELRGEDLIGANRKFRNPLSFWNYAKCFFSTNELPKVRDISDRAFMESFVITEYIGEFEKNDEFKNRLLSNELEIEGLIIASFYALKDLLKTGFEVYTKGKNVMELWKRETNTIYNFIETFKDRGLILVDSKYRTPKDILYGAYTLYVQEELETKEQDIATFTKELKRIRINVARPRVDNRQIRVYEGIGLFTEPQLAQQEPQKELGIG